VCFLILCYEVEIIILKYKSIKQLKEELDNMKANKNSLIILPFCNFSPCFLTHKYYKILSLCKSFCKYNNCHIVYNFYIKSKTHNYLNSLIINKDAIFLIGESFTNKTYEITFKKLSIKFLYYFNASSYFNVFNTLTKKPFVVVLDDEEFFDGFDYFAKKFNKNVAVVCKDGNLMFFKPQNIKKLQENLVKLNIQNTCKLLK